MDKRTPSLIRAIRERKGITLSQLAEKVGKTPSYISDIERGNRRGSYATIAKIAEALEVETDLLWRAS